MPNNPLSSFRVAVTNAQGQPLGGMVELHFQPRAGGQPIILKNQDASGEIAVSGLQPGASYDVTVTLSGGNVAASQSVIVPDSSATPIRVLVGAAAPAASHTLDGTLAFDNGLPAASVT